MASTISIFFTGVCYFLNRGAGKTVEVVIPNASTPQVAHNQAPKHPKKDEHAHGRKSGAMTVIPGHRGYIRYRVDQVPENTPHDLVFRRTDINGNPVLYGAYLLQGERIKVTADFDGSQPVSFASTSTTPEKPPTKKDRLPFSYVINLLEDVNNEGEQMDDEHLKPKNTDSVIGRLDIELGNLAASFTDRDVMWKFKPEALPRSADFLPQAVAWDFRSKTDTITFEFTLFEEQAPHKTLTLKENGNSLDIEIGNAPIDDIVKKGVIHDPDHHFEIYYGLMKKPIRFLSIPHLDSKAPDGGNCPPAQEIR
jgi:hypothetical protein